jgi:DNA-binding transcriptional regulator YiaG
MSVVCENCGHTIKDEWELVADGRKMVVTGEFRRWRKRHGFSSQDLAGALGISRSTLRKWELGETLPHKIHAISVYNMVKKYDNRGV